LWQSPSELREIWQVEQEFKVEMKAAVRQKRLISWRKALDRSLL
jgi:glycerol kinase